MKQSTKTTPPQPEQHTGAVGLNRFIPNPRSALAAGLTSIQFAWDDKWELAVIAILVAVILDALDGATARL